MLTGKQARRLAPRAGLDLGRRVREFFEQSSFGLSAQSLVLLGAALEFKPEDRPRDAVQFAHQLAADLEAAAIAPKL
jgi:hypothetical protein